MAKKEKTMTIQQILETIEENVRKDVEVTIDKGLKSFGCSTNTWRNFEVYETSVKLMKLLLEARAVEYVIAIADKVDEACLSEAKIVVKKEKQTEIWSMVWNKLELMVVLSISDKRLKQLRNSL